MCKKQSIPVNIINLPERRERLEHIRQQFAGKSEFEVTVVEACRHKRGAKGLWLSIQKIVRSASERVDEIVVICEDDHVFTPDYSKANLHSAIEEARDRGADMILGGISWLTNGLPVSENLFWVEKFSGLQFTLIFSKFYNTILNANFYASDVADYKLSMLSEKVFCFSPFISIQKEFGYSDVTPGNNGTYRVESLFRDSMQRTEAIKHVLNFHKKESRIFLDRIDVNESPSNILISTFILPARRRAERKSHIMSQFRNRIEFDIRFVDSYANEESETTYCLNLQKVARYALDNDDDVIVVCDDDHQFTDAYSRHRFMSDIINLHHLGMGVLCGGLDDFDMAVPVSKDKFWIGAFKSAPFLVLYRSVFNKILQIDFDDKFSKEKFFRELTSNKMALFPFISTRKNFGDIGEKKVNPSSEATASRLTRIRLMAESSHII